jgi:putative DNA primase/helicase
VSRLTAATVRAAVPPAHYYAAELPGMPRPKLGRTGWVDGGLCPFHPDRHRGNWRVNLASGAYHCFACGASGSDVVSFHIARHVLGYRDALQDLGRRYLAGTVSYG